MQELSNRLNHVPFMVKGEPAFLASMLRKLPENPNILEIGTFRGLSAVLMAQQRPDAKIITIDPHIGIKNILYSNPYIVEENLKRFKVESQVNHIPLSSNDFYTNDIFDMLFIDGSHEYSWVAHDYSKFEHHVKQGGLIIFHDYQTHKGVTKFCSGLKQKFSFKSMFVVKKE